MLIRPMLVSDIENIAYVERECFKDCWSVDLIRAMYQNSYDFVELAEDGGKIAAYANLRILGDEAELMRIAVLKDRRQEGISKLLIKRIFRIGIEKEASIIRLEVRSENFPAISLYKKFRFIQNGIRKSYYSNPTEDAILMEKYLKN